MSQVQSAGVPSTQVVYVVVRYGQVVGCYSSQDDAMQVVSTSIAKGQLCDLIVKPLIQPIVTPIKK